MSCKSKKAKEAASSPSPGSRGGSGLRCSLVDKCGGAQDARKGAGMSITNQTSLVLF